MENIKTNELRIGNLVYYNGNHKEIGNVTSLQPSFYIDVHQTSRDVKIGINGRFDIVYDIESIKPIPLTEEILLKCGFIKNKFDDNFEFGEFSIRVDESDFVFMWNGFCIDINLKYLHKLQNLYYILNNKELNVTL